MAVPRSLLFLILALPLSPPALALADAPATAPAGEDTRKLVESATAEVLGLLRDKQMPLADKSRRASAIVEANIDFPTFARLSLGPAWKEMSEAQQREFLTLFHALVRGIFIEGIDQYDQQDAAVVDEKLEPKGDRIVKLKIIDTRGGKRRDAIAVDFRLRQFDGRWKAIDLSIANISIAVACRAQFNAVIKEGGIERVLEVLREKNQKQQRKEGERK